MREEGSGAGGDVRTGGAPLELHDMLQTLSRVQSKFIVDGNPRESFDDLLTEVLRLTRSEYGFIGEVWRDGDGPPYLKAHAITNIAWSPETHAFYEKNAAAGLEFRTLKSLFGAVITTGQTVIANSPGTDPRRGGLPPGHPALHAFLGLPFARKGHMIGMIGVANRPGGYDDALAKALDPFLATCGALTEAYQNERRRQEADAALREARARLEAALDAGGIATWTWYIHENRMVWDANAAKLFGRTAAEVAEGRPELFFSALHPEDRGRVEEAMRRALEHGTPYAAEFRARRPNGELFWVVDRGRVERDEHGRPHRVVGAAVDVTERKLLEEQLRQSQKMEAVGQLAGGVAHDFNNLLTVIQGHTGLLARAPELGGDLAESVQEIAESAERAARLTRQLLTFSRRQAMRFSPVDLNEVIGNLSRMLHRVVGDDVRVQVQLGGGLPLVEADTTMLEQVLLNLVLNARDAMPDGGDLTIATEYVVFPPRRENSDEQPSGPCVKLIVRDTGMGIPAADLPRVFEPFFTTKPLGKGTGLGLATVYGIVKQHRGWIDVESEQGKGTMFRMYLRGAEEARQTTPAAERRGVRRGSETVLVVEDQAQVRALVRRILALEGYVVLEAPSGAAALEIWRTQRDRIDLLLTDIMMPGGVSGRDLGRRMRADRSDLKVIYTSGYSPEVAAERAGAQAAELAGDGNPRGAFLQKPYQPADLVRVVRATLDG